MPTAADGISGGAAGNGAVTAAAGDVAAPVGGGSAAPVATSCARQPCAAFIMLSSADKHQVRRNDAFTFLHCQSSVPSRIDVACAAVTCVRGKVAKVQ
jgi:hypothetical protein